MQDIRPDGRLTMASRVGPSRVLVWQWGRRGAGPRFALALADGLRQGGGIDVSLSLSSRAEILASPGAPICDLPVETYGSLPGLLRRLVTAPLLMARLARRLRQDRPQMAICAMAGPLDLLMAAVLHWSGIPFALIVHEADAHPGDAWQIQYRLQRILARRARVVVALSRHVAAKIETGRRVVVAEHPPFAAGVALPRPRSHGGRLRVLLFGRLLKYKGLDLLADALVLAGDRPDLDVRVVGSGPETPDLARLRAMPGVRVENRWVPEAELSELLGWSDVVVLAHREASQSGVAAAALGAGRWVISTNVGGLPEQLADAPMAVLCDPKAPALAEAILAMAGTDARQAAPLVHTGDHWADLGRRIVGALLASSKKALLF